METITLYHDTKVFYVKTNTIYQSLSDAYQELIANVPYARDRMYYGITVYENGCVSYRLGVEQLTQNEGRELNLALHIIKRGVYLSSIVRNYLEDIMKIDRVFQHMTSQPVLTEDKNRIEWGFNGSDVACMLRLKQN